MLPRQTPWRPIVSPNRRRFLSVELKLAVLDGKVNVECPSVEDEHRRADKEETEGADYEGACSGCDNDTNKQDKIFENAS